MAQSAETVPFDVHLFCRTIAEELGIRAVQAEQAVRLLQDGNTLPFIARYRKEVTGGLDETQLRAIEDSLGKAEELADRRNTILKTIEEQGRLTADLRKQILDCTDRRTLEDIYLPFKPRKRTRATAAREHGLQPLADILLRQQSLPAPPATLLNGFLNDQVTDVEAALQGACDIVAEVWSEDLAVRRIVLEQAEKSELQCSVKRGKADENSKYANYFDCRERIARLPSHRFLAMNRGADEGILRLSLAMDDDSIRSRLKSRLLQNPGFAFRRQLEATVDDCYSRLLHPAAESQTLQQLKEKADSDAIAVFSENLRQLLLAPPAGSQATIGIDPGFRTGCKLAVVDSAGKFLHSETIYPTAPRSDVQQAAAVLLRLVNEYQVTLLAVGNGTASRETDQFVTELIQKHQLPVQKVIVSEAGASVYSASETAVEEYPDLDVTVRGAISIAHRVQDPLAELVKIDPRSIGVGQYQHDVDQTRLKKALDREVESCVNSVGVDLNTASSPLLSRVAGIGSTLAKRIVEFRDQNGRFSSREQLLKVPRLGQKAFQQAAGFLRIRGGTEPLDNSAVHPEQYPLVRMMAARLRVDIGQLTGNESLVSTLSAADFVQPDRGIGEFTVRDVLQELARPGRDPRSTFQTVTFDDSVRDIADLVPGMKLQAVITNVTRFGAFADIGVHQDGLIHISQLADRFVSDPSEEVSVGDIVTVVVTEIDPVRRRISLSRKGVVNQSTR